MYVILLVLFVFIISSNIATYQIPLEDILKEIINPTDSENLFNFNVQKFVNDYGYPFESHEVTTKDGYILGLHRIPCSKHETGNSTKIKDKPTVFIMHGLDSSSVDFFILGPNRSLAFMLADQGYDVWLGNNRGNTWSRRHIILNPDKDKKFWDYSFHELGLYDDTATIDYILELTQKDQISYVGHSQGNTQFFVMTSMIPKYNEKINVMLALAPPVYMQNLKNPIVQMVKNYFTVLDLASSFLNITEILPHSGSLTRILKSLCKDLKYQEICVTFFFALLGFDSDQLNRTDFTTFLENFPAGTSLKEYKHFLQEVKSGHFREYDYGWVKNMIRYHQMSPPDYNLSKITVPVALYYGNNDWLVGTPDVDRLAEKLPNVIRKQLIKHDEFNHGDFLIAKDVVSLLYSDVINLLNEYNVNTHKKSTPRIATTTSSSRADSSDISPSQLTSIFSTTTTTPSAASRTVYHIIWIYFQIIVLKLVL